MNRINTFKSDSRNAIGNVWTESGRFLLLLLTTMMIYFHCSTNQLPTSSSWSIKYLEFFAFFLLPFENWYKSSDWKAFHYLLKNILIRDDDHWASNWNIYLHITASIPLMDAIYQHFFFEFKFIALNVRIILRFIPEFIILYLFFCWYMQFF